MTNNQVKTDDFFTLLKDERKNSDPFANDEIIILDKKGNLSILKDGKITDFGPLKKKIENEPKKVVAEIKQTPQIDFQAEIDDIIEKSGIHFSDQETERRFRSLILSRLKGARNQIQTREIMLDSPSSGGLGFKPDEAERVLSAISKQAQDMDKMFRDGMSSGYFSDLQLQVDSILKNADSELKKPKIDLAKAKETDKIEDKGGLILPAENLIKPKANINIKPKEDVSPKTAVNKEKKNYLKPGDFLAKKSESKPLFKAPVDLSPVNFQSLSKPKIEDVKFRSRLTGPIEEIRSMTLVDFRRLGKDAKDAIGKIVEKIQILEDESFPKRIQAIRAWKESPVNQLYLELGAESMEKKMPILEVISQRQKNGIDTLTEQEIEEIMEFNKKLRY